MRDDVKSPLKAAPLRVAGQSLSEQLIDNALDRIVGPYIFAALFVALAVSEWIRYYTAATTSPWVYTSLAVIGVGICVIKIRRGFASASAIRQGRDGERAVAEYLERFRSDGFRVFHDVPNGDSNIDHVLVGQKGIYTIETKTLSKPSRGPCNITVSESGIQANGRTVDRNPIVQAKAQARWLHNFFCESDFKVFCSAGRRLSWVVRGQIRHEGGRSVGPRTQRTWRVSRETARSTFGRAGKGHVFGTYELRANSERNVTAVLRGDLLMR